MRQKLLGPNSPYVARGVEERAVDDGRGEQGAERDQPEVEADADRLVADVDGAQGQQKVGDPGAGEDERAEAEHAERSPKGRRAVARAVAVYGAGGYRTEKNANIMQFIYRQ